MQRRVAKSAGFSLIEVIITIGILMSLTIAVASMLKAGFEVREGLSEKSRLLHRLSAAMGKLSEDVQQSFFVSTKDGPRNGIGRKMKTVFKIEKAAGSASDKLSLTTKTHRPINAGRFESDLTYVVYQVQESKETPGRFNLYRGEFPEIPSDLHDDPPMRLLAKNIKTLTLEPWDGEKWSKDFWDTGRGDTRGILPRMVKITVEAWLHDRAQGDGQEESVDLETDKMQTVVYLSDASEYKEIKEGPKSIKWDGL